MTQPLMTQIRNTSHNDWLFLSFIKTTHSNCYETPELLVVHALRELWLRPSFASNEFMSQNSKTGYVIKPVGFGALEFGMCLLLSSSTLKVFKMKTFVHSRTFIIESTKNNSLTIAKSVWYAA